MTKPLKVFHWDSFRSESPVSPNGSTQTNEMMACRSAAELMRATGMSRHHVDTWVAEGASDEEEALARSNPGVLFWQPMNLPYDQRDRWVRDGEAWPTVSA